MHRGIKIAVALAGGIILFTILKIIFNVSYHGHDHEWHTKKEIEWIIRDSVRKTMRGLSYSWIGKEDELFFFPIDDSVKTKVDVWEFEENIEFQNLKIDTNYSEDKLNKGSDYEALNKGSGLVFYLNYGYEIKKNLTVGLDDYSKIKKTFKGDNYIGVLAEHVMEIYVESNSKTDIYIQKNFDIPQIGIILYKKEKKTYLIIVSSMREFDERVFNIFNLE